MTTTEADVVLRHVRGLVTPRCGGEASDGQLLGRFADRGEEAAFAALVRRHGPLVYGVCRRVLGNHHDAEDAFQAAFLVLAQKAASVDRRDSVGSWLHRVAYHVAMKASKRTTNRKKRESRAAAPEPIDPLAEVTGRELFAAFDEEVQNLPERHRVPLVLCYLQGLTRDEAARQLGCAESTLHRRLAEARQQLRRRLARRGLELPAALLATGVATATVPTVLASAATRAAMDAATVSAQVAALVRGSLRAMAPAKARTARSVLLAVALSVVGAAAFAVSLPDARDESKPPPAAEAPAPPADESKDLTVNGRVVGTDGKPLPGAAVVVMARLIRQYRGRDETASRDNILAEAKADAEGRFSMRVERKAGVLLWDVYAVAAAEKHAPTWRRLSPVAETVEAVLKLSPEQVIRGSLVDLQGVAAAGVKVSVSRIGRTVNGQFDGVAVAELSKRGAPWPQPVTADEKGRFVVRGCNRDQGLFLSVSDERFAVQSFPIDAPGKPRPGRRAMGLDVGGNLHVEETNADDKGQPEVLRLSLAPARVVEGRVVYEDTGKPAPKTTVQDTLTDADGRFRLRFAGREAMTLEVYPPEGEPYFSIHHRVQWPKGVVREEVEIKLPRGVQVRGKVTEAASGNPVAGAGVQFWPRSVDDPNRPKNVLTGWFHRELTKEDGTFRMTVLPGAGHLLIQGPAMDYVHEEIGSAVLSTGKPGGSRKYPDAAVKLDVKANEEPNEVAVKLRRGFTVRGRLLGPDGKPVARAVMLHRLYVGIDLSWHFATEARDGVFEIHGLDAAKAVPVYFLDAENQCGAIVELSGKQAGEIQTVKLAPCGRATARYVDGKGQPVAEYAASPDIVVTPGPTGHHVLGERKGELFGDVESLTNLDRHNYWDRVRTDAKGRITFPALIPGATYRLGRWDGEQWRSHKEFTVESGKMVDLGDVPIVRRE